MKRIRKRVIGVALGLALGWMAQGYWQSWQSPAAAQSAPAAQTPAGDQSQHPNSHDDEYAYGLSDQTLPPLAVGATQLIPVETEIPWLGAALVGALGLFAAAIVLGPFVSRFEDSQATARDAQASAAPVVHHHKGSH